MMKFLIIEQDLRMSGTSAGIVSRSFLAKLRLSYPSSVIDVVYLRRHSSDDQLSLLPVDSITIHFISSKVPLLIKWWNKFYWRFFHVSLNERYIQQKYRSHIKKIDWKKYDHIFIRSAGIEHETILGAKGLPILKQAIINFHDPYPLYWYPGAKNPLSNLELFRMKDMAKVVSQAKKCMSSAYNMSQDLQYLFGSRNFFFTLPHQYSESVFDFDLHDKEDFNEEKSKKKVVISYHGAIQFGRNIHTLLDAYQELLKAEPRYSETTEMFLRLKGIDLDKLRESYKGTKSIKIHETTSFSESAYEQKYKTDINIILENGPLYCNILVGKAPFLNSTRKPVLSLSPARSEMRRLIKDEQYIANSSDIEEIKEKLRNLIQKTLNSSEPVYPFGDYFGNKKFKTMLDNILKDEKNYI